MRRVALGLCAAVVSATACVTDEPVDRGEAAWVAGDTPDDVIACEAWTAYDDERQATVGVRLSNLGAVDVDVLRWGTAWDADLEVFEVTSDAGPVPFFGIRPFGREARPEDYVTITAGGSVEVEYRLAFNHLVEAPARVSIRHVDPTINVRSGDVTRQVAHACGQGTAELAPVASTYATSTQGLQIHEDCTTEQRQKLAIASHIAFQAARIGERLAQRDVGLYEHYFGTRNPGRGELVAHRLRNMSGSEWDEQVRCFSTRCSETGVEGYYDPNWDRIYLCNWDKPLFRVRDASITGSLIHEMAHNAGAPYEAEFEVCGGACYGYEGARALAQHPDCVSASGTCPALQNAENYEHYAPDAYVNQIMLAIY